MPIDYKLLLNEGYNNIIASAESALSGISTMVTSRKELIFDSTNLTTITTPPNCS